jgi:biopolymer transport protein ExbD
VNAKTAIPLIDLILLTLGSVLAAMTQMQRIEAIDVDVARVGPGPVAVRRGEIRIVTVSDDGLTLDGQAVRREQLADALAGSEVVLRAERSLPTQRTLALLAELTRAAGSVSVEVEPDKPQPGR